MAAQVLSENAKVASSKFCVVIVILSFVVGTRAAEGRIIFKLSRRRVLRHCPGP